MNILVTGATGTIGEAVVQALGHKGYTVYQGIRNPESLKIHPGIAIRQVDFDRDDFSEKVFGEIDVLYLVAPVKDPAKAIRFIDAAYASGIKHIIFSSGRTTGDIPGKPLHDIENYLKELNKPFTIIRPGWFMQNFYTWLGNDIREHHKIALPAADAKTTFVDVRDIGEAVGNMLDNLENHHGQTYDLIGHEALSHKDVADIFTLILGKTITYEPLSEQEYIDHLINTGASPASAKGTAFLYEIVRTGKEEERDDKLAQLLNRPPRDFQDFVEDYRSKW